MSGRSSAALLLGEHRSHAVGAACPREDDPSWKASATSVRAGDHVDHQHDHVDRMALPVDTYTGHDGDVAPSMIEQQRRVGRARRSRWAIAHARCAASQRFLSVEGVAQRVPSGAFRTLLCMPQNFIECDREQGFLLPPDVREWLPADHLAWFVIEAVARMDLGAFYAAYRVDGHRRAAYEPSVMG